jgi:hypothetical protein
MACIFQKPATGRPDAQPGALSVDHLGIVVRDLAAEVAAWRAAGFRVSDPQPLMGRSVDGHPVPLGQSSAHVVFENGYVELSSPLPGSGNHLEPYLAKGEGVRILVLAASEAEAARQALLARWPTVSDVRVASREVAVDGATELAFFHWFPLPFDVVPDVLSAVVEHRSRLLVLHPSFVTHDNGWRRIAGVVASGRCQDLLDPGLPEGEPDAPRLVLDPADGQLAITALVLSAPGKEDSVLRIA